LVIEQLQTMAPMPRQTSRFLPLRAKDVLRWLIEEDSADELAWERGWTSGPAIAPQT